MATFNLLKKTPAVPTTLTAYPAVKAITLTWDNTNVIGDVYEVWWHTANVSGSATKIATVSDNTYTDTDSLTGGSNNYYWVKAVNSLGTASAFSTGTGAVVTSGVASADTLPPTSVTTGSTSITITGSTTAVSTYGTWYSQGYAEFTATTNEIVSISKYLISTISSVSSTGFEVLNVSVRARLYNTTISTDVPGGTDQYLLYYTFGTATFGSLVNITNISKTYIAGFRGLLIPGNVYRLYIDIQKAQVSGSPTCSISINSVGSNVTGAAALS